VSGRPGAWLVRHGQTEWSLSGRHTGTTDLPLTDEGRAQATGIAARLAGRDFALVLSSPRSRALDTARLAGFGDRLEVDPDLAEWDYGDVEGLTSEAIRERFPGWTIWRGPWPGGEAADAVAARADRIVERIRGASGDALVFSHGHLLRVLAARWAGLAAADGGRLALSTATLSVLGWDREAPVIQSWNEACRGG